MDINETGAFIFNPEAGVWTGDFNGELGLISHSDCETDKPIYLAVMARRQQLQPILDNSHLFDSNFINAVRILVMHHEHAKLAD